MLNETTKRVIKSTSEQQFMYKTTYRRHPFTLTLSELQNDLLDTYLEYIRDPMDKKKVAKIIKLNCWKYYELDRNFKAISDFVKIKQLEDKDIKYILESHLNFFAELYSI